jgi:hypothetical protein
MKILILAFLFLLWGESGYITPQRLTHVNVAEALGVR